MSFPIIFIHYNDSKYLKYSLDLALRNNPNKKIILLGDNSNKQYESLGVQHYCFDDFLNGSIYNEFIDCYRFIAGERFERVTYGEPWTAFNFKKWFALSNFLVERSISNFWLFDSDVFVLTDLSHFEDVFYKYDYTSWNQNHQLQGYGTVEIVKKYCRFIIDCFQDKEYLEKQISEFKNKPNYGLTLMRVFKLFQERYGYSIENIFDRRIEGFEGIFTHNFSQVFDKENFDFESIMIGERMLKQLYVNSNGELFVNDLRENRLIIIYSLDMSWLNQSVIRKIYRACTNSDRTDLGKMKKLDLKTSLIERMKMRYHSITNKG